MKVEKISMPASKFIKFKIGKVIFNGMIVEIKRKGYFVLYNKNYPTAANFFNAKDYKIVGVKDILPY